MSNIKTETHGEAEVFVLPPDLLEKLGINLCNIAETVQQSRKSIRENNKHCIKNATYSNRAGILNNVSNSQDSSILETANLMKNAVVLGPTFVPIAGDAILGEVEIAKKLEIPVGFNATELKTKDNHSNYNFNQENVIFESRQDSENDTSVDTKQSAKSRILKETDPSAICNGKRRNNIQSQTAKYDSNEIIVKKNFNLGDVKSKLKLKCLRARDVHESTLKNNIQSLDVSQGSIQIDELLGHKKISNINHEVENVNHCVLPTLDNLDCGLGTEKAFVIPVTMQTDMKCCLNLNGFAIADNSHNIIDDHQSFIDQDIPNSKEKPFVIPVLSANPLPEESHIANSDIIKYTGCDESVDMELDNMLHETEILIPSLSTTTVDEEINKTSHLNSSHEKGLHNNVQESVIVISLSPELTNISNISQNIGDTQDINIDILYESFDEHSTNIATEIANVNQQQKVSNSVACEPEQEYQSKGIDIDIINHIECDETSDMELDNMLRETEILISTSSNTTISDGDKLKPNNEYEMQNKEEVNIFKTNEAMSPIEFKNVVIDETTNSYLLNSLQIEEEKGKAIIINHNDSFNEIKNYKRETNALGRIIDYFSTFHLDHISSTKHVDKNIIHDKNTVKQHVQKYSDDNFYDKSIKFHCNTNNEIKLKKGLDDVVVNNNFIYGIEENKNKIKDLEDLSNKDTHSKENDPYAKVSRNYKQTENNYIGQSPDIIISSKNKAITQNDDSLGMSVLPEKAANNVDVSHNSIQNEKMESIMENKVKEIAKYLKEAYRNKCGVRFFKPKVGIHSKSKIFIQGVEKPGGSGEHELVFNKFKLQKTYEKKKKRQLHFASTIKRISLETIQKPEENSIEIKTSFEPSLYKKRQEYCLCGDFGKLTYVGEYNNLYEHIHFGSNISVNCPVNTVFEIYNENSSLAHYGSREYAQEKEICNERDSGHICWQRFEYQENENVSTKIKMDENAETFDNTNSETTVPLKVPSTTITLRDAESACMTKRNINKKDANCDSNVSNEINENILSEMIIEENAVESQIDESKEKENNMLLDQRYTKNVCQYIEIERIDELKRNLSDYGTHINDAVMDSNTDIISETVHITKNRKRKIKNNLEELSAEKNVKCGVCEQMFAESEWEDHISKVHYYIAWKDGHTIDFENLLLMKKIKKKLKNKGSLICTFCGFEYVKLTKFLSHVKRCFSKKVPKYKIDNKEPKEVSTTSKSDISKCGVCQLEVSDVKWIEHISEKHHYLAWKDGEPPLDMGDENKVKDHLLNLVKNLGHLICVKCGLLRKYSTKSIKNYLTHIEKCTVKSINESRTSRRVIKSEQSIPVPSVYKCAVCEKAVDASKWSDHVSKQHNYRAWKDGEAAPNFDDKDALWEYLNEISKKEGGLECSKCGVVRKYVKSYLQHIGSCTANVDDIVDDKATVKVEIFQADAASLDTVNSTDSSKKSRKRTYKDFQSSINEEMHADVLSSDTVNSTDDKLNKLHSAAPSVLNSSDDVLDVLNSTDSPNTPLCTCGVCNMAIEDSKWIDHIGSEHNYIAWKAGETPLDLDDTEEIWQHLYDIVTYVGKLICAKCGIERKYPKSFLQHIRDCRGPVTSSNDTKKSLTCSVISQVDRYLKNKDVDTSVTELKCGVCQEVSERDAWIAHIQTAHNYIAWIDGETPLDEDNQDMIREHLQKIVDEIGALVCAKCGTSRKYAKKFLQHVQQCSNENKPTTLENKHESGNSARSNKLNPDEIVTCGACMQKIRINQWMSHIRLTHNYVAWKTNQASVNTKKTAQIEKRLRAIIDKIQELICPKCGYKSKDVEVYLQHTGSCTGNPDYEFEDSEATELAQKGLYQCAMCQEKIKYGEWKNHVVDKHYNVGWVVGDEPIDLLNQHVITKILKEYLNYGSYVCKVCGITRSSGTGFYAHFVTCGLSEEESDKYKTICDICDSKILGIYKHQHMGLHTQRELAKERREKEEEDRLRERERKLEALAPVAGPRRAAERARMVIEETVRQFKHVCQRCAFATELKEEMSMHKCPKRRKKSDELDLSLEQESSDEDEDLEEINESASDDGFEEDEEDDGDDLKSGKRKHNDSHSASARITRVPFVVPHLSDYLSKNAKDNAEHYFTTETLFPEWIQCIYKAVPEEEMLKCLPPLDNSCKVYSNASWQTYKRWQAVVDKEKTTIFVGYSIQRLSWLPAHVAVARHNHSNFLCVACHPSADCPQYDVGDLPEHPTLIQIWDFQDFKQSVPKLAMGLFVPFGTVWALEWCPSGARECLEEDSQGFVRMGLLAVACSNGMAYILSVPYPSTVVTSDSIFYKLEPVAQLKFTMKSDRPKYQATAICWSKQKGHSTVIVGYSDGSSAYYDLNTESPFLKTKENNVTVFYPFFDERIHNGCVTDLSSFPMAHRNSLVGAVSAASPTGSAVVTTGAAGRCAQLRSHLASSSASFLPAWPAVFLAGEDVITNASPNELEYYGFGRRAGPVQVCCGCSQCGMLVTYMAPFLRSLRPHHARSDLNKLAIAWIGARQLGKKRKHNEDKKDVPSESLTYEDTVMKYGIEFKFVSKSTTPDAYKKSISHYKEVNPERFPLSDVRSMAFCPSTKHHERLAIATHAGIIFVLKV